MLHELEKFVKAQENSYQDALAEVKNGKKTSHWMWYIFPQLRGLGHSSTSAYYGIGNLDEAVSYLKHPLLGPNLIGISMALLSLSTDSAYAVFGSPDDKKLQSCMTLFSMVPGANPVFKDVLKRFFNGARDVKTLDLLERTMLP